MYIYLVALVGLFIMGFLWVLIYAVMVPVQSAVQSQMSQFDVTNSTHEAYELAEIFMSNIIQFLLVFATLILLYWCWLYAQRKSIGGGFY